MNSLSKLPKINAIVATKKNDFTGEWLIGMDGKIPWHDSKEMAYFKKMTMGGAIVMRKKNFRVNW